MAVYEYRCAACGEVFQRSEHMSEHAGPPPHCPKCESADVRQRFAPVFARTSKKS